MERSVFCIESMGVATPEERGEWDRKRGAMDEFDGAPEDETDRTDIPDVWEEDLIINGASRSAGSGGAISAMTAAESGKGVGGRILNKSSALTFSSTGGLSSSTGKVTFNKPLDLRGGAGINDPRLLSPREEPVPEEWADERRRPAIMGSSIDIEMLRLGGVASKRPLLLVLLRG
jgi:hypothetical protein